MILLNDLIKKRVYVKISNNCGIKSKKDMMRNVIKKIVIIFFLLYSLFFVIGSTLSPVFAHFKLYEQSSLITSLYVHACHQQPDRSFWLFGYPIALCCRCYGFYIGVVVSSIIALFNKLKLSFKVFSLLLFLIIIDITLNFIVHINTGNIVRFTVGIIMGFLFISTVSYLLNYKKENSHAN